MGDELVIVIEDDPSTGQDHVDMHRSIALFASPWVKRGYVSHGHYDVASLHKLFANIFGKPYRERGDRERGPAARPVHVDAGLHAVHATSRARTPTTRATRAGTKGAQRAASGTSASPTSSRAWGSSCGSTCTSPSSSPFGGGQK